MIQFDAHQGLLMLQINRHVHVYIYMRGMESRACTKLTNDMCS